MGTSSRGRRRLFAGVLYSLLPVVSIFCGHGSAADAPVRIVTLGDSITHGVRPGVKADETFSARLEAMLHEQKMSVEVVNVGIGGERTDQALLRLDKDVIARKPTLVTIMYGTNDSYVDKGNGTSRITADEYRTNLEKLVERLRAAGIQPVLMTAPRWGRAAVNGAGENPNVRLEKYVVVCRDVAKKKNVPLVDHFRLWTERDAAGVNIGALTTDQCHPNPEGHNLIAQTMLPVVSKALVKARK